MFSLPFKLRSGLYLVCVAVCFWWRGLWFLARATFFLLVFVHGILILPDGFVDFCNGLETGGVFLDITNNGGTVFPVFLREGFQLY